MSTILFNTAALQVNEYLLVVNLHEDIYNRIMQIKQNFAEKFDYGLAKKTYPHITLIHFLLHSMNEDRMVHRIRNIVEMHEPFKVELHGYGSFPAHTIYINVFAKHKMVNLVKSIRSLQKWMKPDNEHKPHFILEPHLTVARKLQAPQYEKAWIEYEHEPFSAAFMANDLLLLKRKPGEHYSTVAKFSLEGKSVSETIQSSLFT
jgi:2'-5' RNA ligase